ncbi:MAG: hypothetical protein ABH827_01725 [bacterium]
MFQTNLTKRQARYLAGYIVKNGGQYALNNSLCATSTRITFEFDEDELYEFNSKIYSNYTHQNVVDELPQKYQKFNWQ